MYKIDFSRMPYKYWGITTKISYLQRLIIVHSIIYYEMNSSCITDKEYDMLCKQLVELQKSVDKETLKRTQYYYVMYDFDGTTGFDMCGRLDDVDKPYLKHLARIVLSEKR